MIRAVESQETIRWDALPDAMMQYGCQQKWTKDSVEKKWHELQHNMHRQEYEASRRDRASVDFGMDSFSEGTLSYNGSERGGAGSSVVSPHATMNGPRSRQGSDASSHYQMQHHIPQHPMWDTQHQNWQGQ